MDSLDLSLIGASDAPVLLGLSPYRTPLDLYRRIVDGAQQPRTAAQSRGLALEHAIALAYQRRVGTRLVKAPSLVRPKDRVWQRVTPDYYEGDAGLVEIKTASEESGAHRFDAEVPEDYLVQVQLQLEATDRTACAVPALIAPSKVLRVLADVCACGEDKAIRLLEDHAELRVYRVEYDAELAGLALEACARFWRDHIVTKKPPPDGAVKGYRPASAEVESALAEVVRLRAERDAVEARLSSLEAWTKEAVGEGVTWSGGRASYRRTKDGTKIDWQAVATELASIAALHGIDTKEVQPKHTSIKSGFYRFLIQEAK